LFRKNGKVLGEFLSHDRIASDLAGQRVDGNRKAVRQFRGIVEAKNIRKP
jgi:hypothetical protein